MIDFACRCGFKFSVPEDMAGGAVQCPRCKLLVNIPGLGDLASLESDGTLKFQESPVDEEAANARFRRAYEQRVDEEGAIDLRPTMDDVLKAGADDVPFEQAEELRPGAPKYDPETGELIQPMAMKPQQQAPEIPMAAVAPVLNYAIDAERPLTILGIPLRLMLGGNIVAMVMLLLCHVFLSLFMFILAAKLYFTFVLPLFVLVLVISHYANVIEEIGPFEKNDIPTPARDLSWGDDLFWPFLRIMVAVCAAWPFLLPIMMFRLDARGFWNLAHWPLLGLLPGGGGLREFWLMSWGLFLVGAIFFPALLLTTTTSTAVGNLRPDRVFGVMRICGRRYIVAVLLCVVAVPLYWMGLCTTCLHAMGFSPFMSSPRGVTYSMPSYIAYPILFLGIYLVHLLCYHLGRSYRACHEKFPWLLQVHKSTKKIERRIPPRRPRKKPAPEPQEAIPVDESTANQSSEPISASDVSDSEGPIPLADENAPPTQVPLSPPRPNRPIDPLPLANDTPDSTSAFVASPNERENRGQVASLDVPGLPPRRSRQ